MSANNELNLIIAEIVPEVDAMPVTEGQILSTDYEGDASAEFYCQYYNNMTYFESFLEDPEKLCLPDEDGEIPYVIFIEMMRGLTGYKWAKRTWNRMERRTAGIPPADRLTQIQKSEHPDYKDWNCHYCLSYYKGKTELEKHQKRSCCKDGHNRLYVKATKDKVPTPTFFHTAASMDELFGRVVEYKKNIEPELEPELIEEQDEDFDDLDELTDEDEQEQYSIKLWVYNPENKVIEYAGLWESIDGETIFTDEDLAIGQYNLAVDCQEYTAVRLVNNNTDSIMDEYEDELYLDEDEDNETEYVLK